LNSKSGRTWKSGGAWKNGRGSSPGGAKKVSFPDNWPSGHEWKKGKKKKWQ
jgi:hypothetical protein